MPKSCRWCFFHFRRQLARLQHLRTGEPVERRIKFMTEIFEEHHLVAVETLHILEVTLQRFMVAAFQLVALGLQQLDALAQCQRLRPS